MNSVLDRRNQNYTLKYTLLGVLFGFLFPVIGTFLAIISEGMPLSSGFVYVQSTNVLLWIIDTAPIFLGGAAFLIGRKQDRLTEFNSSLAEKIKEKTISLEQEIKEGKEREKELIEMRRAAEMGVEIKDQFLSNISHEIRTLMNGVLGMIDLLAKQTKLDAKQLEYLSLMEYSAKNLLVIINDILDLSKANADKLELRNEDFSLYKLLDNLEATLLISASEKGIELRVSKDNEVPDRLFGDAVRLYQILMNLGNNAIKFTSEGKVDVDVKLLEEKADGFLVRFSVIDTGVGIPSNLKQDVFRQFTQVDDGISKRYGGTGLGLSIVQKLVELFDGKLELDSQVGRGSTFYVDLLLPGAKEETEAANGDVKKELSMDTRSSLKVILAEDNKINQVFAESALNRLGINVQVAENGKEVIALLRKNQFDLILMDIQMPEMDGLETTRYIRGNMDAPNKNIKIIAVTAAVMDREVQQCFDAGVNQYISKPFNPDDLMEKITELIG